MTHRAGDYGIARWSRAQRETLLITDSIGNVLDTYLVPPAGDRPEPEMLWRTAWCAYPGTEWQEEPPGQWTRAVFCQPGPGRNGEA